MNEKHNINSSESLLYTDIRILMGGKGSFDSDLLKEHLSPPPVVPPLALPHGDDKPNNKLPELVNSNVNDVLSTPPGWLISWGTTVFFMVFLGIIAITWFVEYPDLVSANLKVVSNNLPKSIISKTDGMLSRLFVKEGQVVQKEQVLAYLESTAKHDEVLALETTVDNLILQVQKNNINGILSSNIPSYYNLGELQKSFQAYQQALMQAKSAAANGVFNKKKQTIGSEIGSLRRLQESTRTQLDLQEQDLAMALEDAQSQQRLSDKGYVSKLDAKNAMAKYLNKKQALEQARGSLETNTINQTQKQQDIYEIDKSLIDQKVALIQSINTLKSDIEAWKQRYIALATTAGKVNFLSTIQENQIIKAGQELMYILPEGTGFYGQMMVGQYNFGRIKMGQEVIVKFPSYPFQEFGTVKGMVTHISDVAQDSAYLVKVHFPLGLKTSSNKMLPFKNGMTASGDIITDNLKLMEKFFYDIRKSMKR